MLTLVFRTEFYVYLWKKINHISSFLFPKHNRYANKFRIRNVFLLSRLEMLLLLIGVAFTVLVSIYAEHLNSSPIGQLLVNFNEVSIHESLNLKVALPWIGGALLPFVLATILATLAPKADRRKIIKNMYIPFDMNSIPEYFPPQKWLNCPAGVGIFLWVGDILCAKVGASIAGTMLGISVFLQIKGAQISILVLGCFFVCHFLCIFPRWIRSICIKRHAFQLSKGKDSCSIYRREWRRYI